MVFSASSQPYPPPEGVQQRSPRYPGEDTTPTSKQEIWGWYAYGIAAEVFAVCAVGALVCYVSEGLCLTVMPQAPSSPSPWSS